MWEVSREATTVCPAGLDDFTGDLMLLRGALEVLDMLACDCL